MDIIEKIYEGNRAFVENENFKGVKKIIVDNYSDEAHFIYEMLQNADDAMATEITFELQKDQLIVTHNGIPFNQKDLEGICSISKGTKSDDSTKIGKFGIGFKSVFVYTESPQIYSGDYSFEIRELVLPQKLQGEKLADETKTVFVLPFNAKKTKSIAKERIGKKLETLYEEAIIFLKNIKVINTVVGDDRETLRKVVIKDFSVCENTKAEYIKIIKDQSDIPVEDVDSAIYYYLFERNNLMLYDTDEDGEKIEVKDQSVMVAFLEHDGIAALSDFDDDEDYDKHFFVFFPTRIQSNCDFLVHAPFVTKSSRDTIALNNEANEVLMKNIGTLVADSLLLFAKENMLSVDLMEKLFFANDEIGFGNTSIFMAFTEEYTKLLNARRALIPCVEGSCKGIQSVLFTSESEDSCKKMRNLFGMKWLSDFYGIKNTAEFCYVDDESIFFDFIEETYGTKKMDISDIVYSLKAKFYEEKTTEWFADYVDLIIRKTYYGYSASYDNLDRLPLVRTKNGKHRTLAQASKVYLNNGTLDEKLLEDSKCEFLYKEVFKLKEFSTELQDAKDSIRKLSSGAGISFDEQLDLLRKVYIALENKKISSSDISNEQILSVINQKTGAIRRVSPQSALVGRWERTNGTFDLYTLCAGVDIELTDPRYLEAFTVAELKQLGCKTDGLSLSDNRSSHNSIFNFFNCNGMKGKGWYETHLRPLVGRANNRQFQPLCQMVCFDEIMSAPMTIEKSVIILRLAKEFDNQIKDWVEWSSRGDFGRSAAYQGYDNCFSLFGASLVLNQWMYNNKGELVRPSEVSIEDLASDYRKVMTADIADKLGLKKTYSEKIETVNQKLESDGLFAIPISEKEVYEEFKRQQAARKSNADSWSSSNQNDLGSDAEEPNPVSESPVSKTINEIAKKTVGKKVKYSPYDEAETEDEEQDVDVDEYTPATVDYGKQSERLKQKNAAEIAKIAYLDELQQKAVDAEKYTFGWFKALLEMECLSSGEANNNRREVSIRFADIEREVGTERRLILKHPDKYIPQFIEDLADIPMVLHFEEQTRTIAIEATSIQSYSLRVKVKNPSDLNGIVLSDVKTVSIDVKSPAFLLEELRKKFEELEFEDDFNMQENLCHNIEFVFGPPGTGKTTHLANNVLIPMMRDNSRCKVLVLTPTNKSADVLVRRIMEVSGSNNSYKNWLVRFGTTDDESIEQSPVFRDKSFDIRTLAKNVTVTTIARFPYDFFMPDGARVFLSGINWDYIVIDEASMISLADIVLPLYLKTPKKFIIAGDPFQIEPITMIDMWKNENIYTMVHLNSFVSPKTRPVQYKVELLTTQYRSIPEIGEIFSNFAYGGILKHNRSSKEQRKLNLGRGLKINSLNILKFPVSKYESIYRCKRLQHSSSYQVYSALFTYEYVSYLSREIANNNPNEFYRIGIIAPYRAQSDLIEKLVAAERLPQSVDVQVGTIHGFQGDECDIIFAVFNTPPTISPSEDMFLNKVNIVNVSISRARDYLFIVMPDDDTENVSNLKLIKKVEKLVHESDSWQELKTPDLELMMFDDSKYLENNAFSTSHQSVNVYGLPEKRYEVRTEDTAVDLQIHKSASVIVNKENAEKTSAQEIVHKQQQDCNEILDIETVPEELRSSALEIMARGAINGKCYLVPYEGPLRNYTIKKTVGMFIVQNRNGQDKMVSVSVIEEGCIIYISTDKYKLYEQSINSGNTIEVRKSLI